MERLMTPACSSLICDFVFSFFFSGKDNIEGTNSSKSCVWCLYSLLHISVLINFVDLAWEKVHIYIMRRVLKCAFDYDSLIVLRWLCGWQDIKIQLTPSVQLPDLPQWLERRTRDWKVAGSNPCWNGGRIFFSRVNFLCWLLFRHPFHPRVTAVARKRSRSSCQKCRWQVTAKHTYTLCMWLCTKWHGAWLYGVHRTRWDGSRFMWHQPCQRC